MEREEIEVRHEKSAKRFAARIDSKIAYLSYEERKQGVLNFAHTYVPPEYRDRGIAEKITKEAFEYARTQGLSVIPGCSYVQYFLKNHPEYSSLVKQAE